MDEKTFVILDEDQKELVLGDLSQLHGVTGELFRRIKADGLSEEFCGNLLSLSEFKLRDLCVKLNYDSILAKEIDNRYAELRNTYQTIDELEQQLASKHQTAGLKEYLQHLAGVIQNWWKTEGLGHVSKIMFTEHGHCQVELSCGLFGHRFNGMQSDTPHSDKEQYKHWLETCGYDISYQSGDHDPDILDTQKNRERLRTLFITRFPSGKVLEWKNRVIHKCPEQFELVEMRCMIYHITDVE